MGVVIFIGVVSCRRSGMRSAGVAQQTSPAAAAAAATLAAAGHPLGNERRPDIIPGYVPPKSTDCVDHRLDAFTDRAFMSI